MTREEATVVIVVPPFASAIMPMLGPSLLKHQLRKRGIPTSIIYANLIAARELGVRVYQDIADSDVRLLWGEQLLAQSDPTWGMEINGSSAIVLPDRLRTFAERLCAAVDQAADIIGACRPRIVGFSSSFQQNVASVLLARRVRRLSSAMIVIGGANMDVPMGAAFHDRFSSEFDHVFSGEADESFPSFCQDFLGPKRTEWPHVIVTRPAQADVFAGVPDYEDFFLQGGGDIQTELTGERILPIEMSRGCWWGQKHHCTFCGLNANGMQYRAKPGPTVMAELKQIVERYAPKLLFATDNIMPRETVRSGAPFHLSAGRDFRFFFETKSNLSESDLDQLVRLGIWEIQPGIESLSTAVLRLLRKGNSGPTHLCLLREAASRQIHVIWNLLVDVPGDLVSDYHQTLQLIPALAHLQPPTGCSPIRIDRYSPYFNTPKSFGINNVRPIAPFTALFGEGKSAENMCYFFDADYDSVPRRSHDLAVALHDAVAAWQRAWIDPMLRRSLVGLRNLAGGYVVVAQTGGSPPEVTDVNTADEPTLFKTRRPTPATSLTPPEIAVLEHYVSRGIVAKLEDSYVYLPTEPWRGAALRSQGDNACVVYPSGAAGVDRLF